MMYTLDTITEVGPEVPHSLRDLGRDPAEARFTLTDVRLEDLGPSDLGDIEDDEDYERVLDLIEEVSVEGFDPLIVSREGLLLDGYARMNAAWTLGYESLPAYQEV